MTNELQVQTKITIDELEPGEIYSMAESTKGRAIGLEVRRVNDSIHIVAYRFDESEESK